MNRGYEIVWPDEGPVKPRKPRGGALLMMGTRWLEAMLNLPPDVEVAGIYWDGPSASWMIHLRGDSLPDVEEGSVPERAELVGYTVPDTLHNPPLLRLSVKLPMRHDAAPE